MLGRISIVSLGRRFAKGSMRTKLPEPCSHVPLPHQKIQITIGHNKSSMYCKVDSRGYNHRIAKSTVTIYTNTL
jgi:hypothetical protein